MKLLISDPPSAISRSKNPNDMIDTIEILLAAWGMIGLGILIAFGGASATFGIGLALLVFSLGVAGTIFYGWLLHIVMGNLGGKGKFYHGLTALTYAKFPIAFGVLVACILWHLPPLGMFLSLIVLIIFSLMGLSTLYRSVKDFFAVDMITAWIGISIIILGTLLSTYILALGAISTLGGLSTGGFPQLMMMNRMLY